MTLSCAGRAISGGYAGVFGPSSGLYITTSHPNSDDSGWTIGVENDGSSTADLIELYVVCGA